MKKPNTTRTESKVNNFGLNLIFHHMICQSSVQIIFIALIFNILTLHCNAHQDLFIQSILQTGTPCEIIQEATCLNCIMFCMSNIQCYGFACISGKCQVMEYLQSWSMPNPPLCSTSYSNFFWSKEMVNIFEATGILNS